MSDQTQTENQNSQKATSTNQEPEEKTITTIQGAKKHRNGDYVHTGKPGCWCEDCR